jgi:NADH dehydrogenase
VLSACQQAGIKRYLHMSANGTRKGAVSAYHQTKYLAEEEVRASSLDWTIFRPSLIYGRGDQFISMLVNMLTRLPALPVVGDGRYQMQPLPVEQVALSFVKALVLPQTMGKTYHCGGAECLSYNELLDHVAAALGKKPPCKIPQPLMIMRPLVSVFQHLPFFPLTSNQLQMLLEGNCCDTREWLTDFDFKPVPMAQGLQYLGKGK